MSTTMKLAVFLFVVFSSVMEGYSAPSDSSNSTIKDYCIKEVEISEEKVNKFEKNPDDTPDEDIMCYTHCILVTLGVVDDDGKIIIEKFTKIFDKYDMECVKKIPKILECTDLINLNKCAATDE
uniref:Odorant binding protein 14 n=1 Tax=Colaphellus bowringi TaxID=561076 RepID=A0A0S3J3B1_9CUCU|nr:odorant binding protein 14 [Colaphellus bowringi]